MRIAELPDGTRLEFPDGTADEFMDRVVKSHLTPAKESPHTVPTDGMTLKFLNLDTRIPIPSQAVEFLAGAGRRLMDIGTLGFREKDPNADASLDKSGWATAGGVGADLATLVGGGTVLRGAASMPQFVRAAPALARTVGAVGQNMIAPTSIRNAALTAGTYGAATTTGDIGDRTKAAAVQGGLGAIGQAIPAIIGGALHPNVAPDVADLTARGVRMTPGQIVGGRTNIAEQKLMSLPFVGDMISRARNRSILDSNIAVANEVLGPLGAKATKPAGRELVREVQDAVSNAYDDVLPKLTVNFDETVNSAIDAGRQLAAEAGRVREFDSIVGNRVLSKFDQQSQMAGTVFKEADSTLARLARENRASSDNANRALARALEVVRGGLRADVVGSAQDIAKLKAADAAYARLIRMETAAASRGAKEGVFTPAMFGRATEVGQSRGTKAAGEELMGPLADALERRVSTTFPNSGTADRALLSGGLLGASYLEPNLLAGAAIGMGAYSQPGQAVLRAMMMRRPEMLGPIADKVRLAAPLGGLLTPLLPINSGQ